MIGTPQILLWIESGSATLLSDGNVFYLLRLLS